MLIEKTVLDYLMDELDTENIFLEMPNELPDEFIVFRIIDRGKTDQINAVTLEFYSYGLTKLKAAELDEKLREAMDNIVILPEISCHFGGGNDNPDTTIKRPRYRAYYNLFF